MQGTVEFLAYTIVEYSPQCPVAQWLGTESVAVGQAEEGVADVLEDSAVGGALHYLDSELVAEIVEKPDVVIPGEPGDFDSAVGHIGELSEEPDVAPWHNGSVLEPVVEHVAQKVERFGRGGYAPEKIHHTPLVPDSVGDV